MSHDTHTAREKAEAYVRGKLPELMELVKPFENNWLLSAEEEANNIFGLTATEVAIYMQARNKVIAKLAFVPPIQLQHWLRVLRDFETTYSNYFVHSNGWLMWEETIDGNTQIEQIFRFDINTGQPATVAAYQAFNDIVGV